MNEDIQKKLDKITEINDLVDKAAYFTTKLLQEIREQCSDNCENFVEQSEYYPGSYLDTDYTEYFKKCNVCGRYKQGEVKRHGNYA